jgi:hypothetical protein
MGFFIHELNYQCKINSYAQNIYKERLGIDDGSDPI